MADRLKGEGDYAEDNILNQKPLGFDAYADEANIKRNQSEKGVRFMDVQDDGTCALDKGPVDIKGKRTSKGNLLNRATAPISAMPMGDFLQAYEAD